MKLSGMLEVESGRPLSVDFRDFLPQDSFSGGRSLLGELEKIISHDVESCTTFRLPLFDLPGMRIVSDAAG